MYINSKIALQLKTQIDQMGYKLYDLKEEEIKFA